MPYHAFLRVSIHCLLSLTSTTRSRVPARIFELTQPSTTSSPIFLPIFENSTSTTRFNVFSTAVNCSQVLRHAYTRLRPLPAVSETPSSFPSPHTHFGPPHLISIRFLLLPRVFTRFQRPSTAYEHLNVLLTVHTRFRDSPHLFFTYFSPIFIIFDHFHLFFIVFTHFFYHIRVLLRTSTPPQPLSRPAAHF